MNRRWAALIVGWLAIMSNARAAPATRPAQTGAFRISFTQRSPLSDAAIIARRLGITLDAMKQTGAPLTYELAKETFQVYVPADYTGETPYGLLVWINAGPDGHIPQDWLDMLDKHKLIAIGADNSGNDREVWTRMGLALDAAHNMRQKYNLDPRRIYVGGGSGGGRTSSQLGVCFADAFAGGYYMIGVNFYRIMRPEGSKTGHWRAGYMPPPKEVLTLAKQRTRHVLLTGDNDPNREQTQVYARGFEQEGFKYVTYIQVPDMGHAMPDAQWFEKGIVALDAPLASLRTEDFAPTGPSTRPAVAVAKPTSPPPAKTRPAAAPAEDESQRSLRVAKLYVKNRLYDQATDRLRQVAATYPNTPAAKEAEALLQEIKNR